ncbi:hypothetical protein, partial [Geminocystis sp. GBBB08]|uniref:hypothetical protein n=1 Tax=Geminocystis sp. GBBB08 TaxID=2604140 RepID=UPI0027E3AF65
MNSIDLVISFSFNLWLKVNSLPSQIRTDFLKNFHQFLLVYETRESFSLKFKDKNKKIIFFSTNKNLQILAVLFFKNDQVVVKLIDFIENNAKQDIIKEINNNLKIAWENINLDDNLTNINQDFERTLIERKYELKKQDLSINDNDFWCYFPEENQGNNLQILSTQQFHIVQQNP